MRYQPDAPAAVLSPHLDDAVLSAWSVLRRPGEVRVINVCTAVPPPGPAPPWDRLTGARDAAERMRERLDEDREALAKAGRESVALGFLDAHYRDAPIDRDELTAALSAAVGAVSELWAPAGIGAHVDHVQVRDAALDLAGGGPPIRLYAELPYAVRYGWPSWVTGEARPDPVDYDAWWTAALPGGAPLPAAAHRLPAEEMDRKLDALRTYRTQWTALDMADIGLISRPVTLRHEVSFAARAAGLSSPAAAPARR
ncbi:MAG: hypothetical protein QOD53_1133 [Thermoleophilaceae bacterium]|nr:hypothetical protein [Thermoleophilaceae bacterium]